MRKQLFLVLTVGLLLAADAPKDDAAKKEYEKFTGTWTFASLEIEGMKVDLDAFKGAKLVIKGNKFTMNEGGTPHSGTYTVDPTKNPKTIEVVFTDGPDKGKKLLGIYELDGDTYKVCIAMEGKERPKEFVSKPGSGCVLEVLKREKK